MTQGDAGRVDRGAGDSWDRRWVSNDAIAPRRGEHVARHAVRHRGSVNRDSPLRRGHALQSRSAKDQRRAVGGHDDRCAPGCQPRNAVGNCPECLGRDAID